MNSLYGIWVSQSTSYGTTYALLPCLQVKKSASVQADERIQAEDMRVHTAMKEYFIKLIANSAVQYSIQHIILNNLI